MRNILIIKLIISTTSFLSFIQPDPHFNQLPSHSPSLFLTFPLFKFVLKKNTKLFVDKITLRQLIIHYLSSELQLQHHRQFKYVSCFLFLFCSFSSSHYALCQHNIVRYGSCIALEANLIVYLHLRVCPQIRSRDLFGN